MTLKTRIEGKSKELKTTEVAVTRNFLHVLPSLYPFDEEQRIIPYRSYFMDSVGSSLMNVNGSLAVPIYFNIPASLDYDRYITTLSVVVTGANALLNQFGALAALTNGVKFYYTYTQGRIVPIHEAIKTNFDFVRLGLFQPAFGTAANSFQIPNAITTAEAFVPIISLSILVPPFGILLNKGTEQKITFAVRDNLTAIPNFDIIAYGFEVIN